MVLKPLALEADALCERVQFVERFVARQMDTIKQNHRYHPSCTVGISLSERNAASMKPSRYIVSSSSFSLFTEFMM